MSLTDRFHEMTFYPKQDKKMGSTGKVNIKANITERPPSRAQQNRYTRQEECEYERFERDQHENQGISPEIFALVNNSSSNENSTYKKRPPSRAKKNRAKKQITEIENTHQGISPEILALINNTENKMMPKLKDATINYAVKNTDFVEQIFKN